MRSVPAPFAVAILTCVAAACATPAAPGPTPPPAASGHLTAAVASAAWVRAVEGIDEYRLDNGLVLLLFPDPTQSTVTVNVTYFVGSKHEGYGETGMAHLLEHMLFKGTPRFRNIFKLVEDRGGTGNGTTWTDRTNYYETLPAGGDNLRWALELESDRMVHASISDEDLATEFSVVRNELEQGENDPAAVLEERVVSTAYLWHSYGKSAVGSRSDVENVPATRLRAFYTTHYQPDNALVVIAGRFDRAQALAEVQRTLGALPRPSRSLPPSYTVEPVQDGERSVALRRAGDVHLVLALYHAVAAADPDHVAFDALADLLTNQPSGRLYRALVESGLAADVYSSHYLWRDPGFLAVGFRARDGATRPRARATALGIAEGFARRPVTALEVDRWRARTLKELALLFGDSAALAVELSEWAAAGDWRLLFVYRDRVRALTAADVQRVALAYLISSNRTVGEFIPTEVPVRAPATRVPDLGPALAAIAVDPPEPGEAFVASLDNLAARTTMRALAGGLRAALLPKKTRGGKVALRLTLRHGDERSLRGKAVIAELTAALANRGTRTRTFAQLEDEANRWIADIEVGGDAGAVTVQIETVRASLPAAVDRAAEMLRQPALAADQLEIVRGERLADLEAQRQDPNALADNRFERLMSPWSSADPRATLAIGDEIAAVRAVTVAEVRAYHGAFWGAGVGEVAAVGDFDPDALVAQLERQFGGWRSRSPYARLPEKAFAAAASEERIDTADREMAYVTGGHDLALRDDHPDVPALIIASHILGATTGSRLWTRLRERDGLSYGVWGYVAPGALDSAGTLGFGAIVAAANLHRAKAALLEELGRFVAEGVTSAEVEAARAAWREQQDGALADDAAVLRLLARDRYLERDFRWHQARRAQIAEVTAADVNRAIKAWLVPARLIVVAAGDPAKSTK